VASIFSPLFDAPLSLHRKPSWFSQFFNSTIETKNPHPMPSHFQRSMPLLCVTALIAMTLAGCTTATATGDAAYLAPIKIGAITLITGPAPFPEVPAAAQAVFDRVNAEGGINGRQIEFFSEDDGADPAQASQAARRLVDEKQVVALVGSASLV
jgi:branched-chain amino acid transport system substrate-binding protein